MSQTQVNATALLCHFLESGGHGGVFDRRSHLAAQSELDLLLRERMIGFGAPLQFVQCPHCGDELARVERILANNQMLLMCHGECEDFVADVALRQTLVLNTEKLVDRLVHSLGLPPTSRQVIESDHLWRLGFVQLGRSKPQAWYFARQLNDPSRARRLVEQLRCDHATHGARIITSTQMPLSAGSALNGFDTVNLSAVARISQSKFEFFSDAMAMPVAEPVEVPPFKTTLRLVRTEGKARVDGIDYPLEPRQKDLLLALIGARHHELDNAQLRAACGSQANSFSPTKVFDRNQVVYKRFIKYQSGDGVYALQIPQEDRDWLI